MGGILGVVNPAMFNRRNSMTKAATKSSDFHSKLTAPTQKESSSSNLVNRIERCYQEQCQSLNCSAGRKLTCEAEDTQAEEPCTQPGRANNVGCDLLSTTWAPDERERQWLYCTLLFAAAAATFCVRIYIDFRPYVVNAGLGPIAPPTMVGPGLESGGGPSG